MPCQQNAPQAIYPRPGCLQAPPPQYQIRPRQDDRRLAVAPERSTRGRLIKPSCLTQCITLLQQLNMSLPLLQQLQLCRGTTGA